MSTLLSRVFWASTAENAVYGAAGGASTVLALHATDLLATVPWQQVGSGAAIGAALAVLGALSSLKVGPGKGNGNASFLSNVVARDEQWSWPGHGWNPIDDD